MVEIRMRYLLWGLVALAIWMAAKAPSTLVDVLRDAGNVLYAVAKAITGGLAAVTHAKSGS
jgi:hypothetical protein